MKVLYLLGAFASLETVNNHLKTLILIFIPFLSYSQYAEFHADMKTLPFEVIDDSMNYQDVYTMEWLIKGQLLKFGNAPLKVKADTLKIDTLFFRINQESKWETILCNIENDKTYFFDYNMCCGGFLIHSPSDTVRKPIQIVIENSHNSKNYILEYGNTSYVITSNELSFIEEQCESAMSNDTREINIYELKKNAKIEYSDATSCIFYRGKNIKPVSYKRRKLIHFRYVPLNHTNEKLIVDISRDVIKLN